MRLLLIALLVISCSRENKVVEHKNSSNETAIALVRYGNTIYHCSSVYKDECGLQAECGNTTLMCINTDYQVEYLND
jgi:hypothetical protein